MRKIPGYIILIFLVGPIIIGLLGWCYPNTINLLTLIILTLTLFTLFIYTYDTNRLANKTEDDIVRPLLLRTGYFNWDAKDIEMIQNTRPNLCFVNLKNIALEVSGIMVVNNRKYQLLFANDATTESLTVQSIATSRPSLKMLFLEKWGWLPAGGQLFATYDPGKYFEYISENFIEVTYFDTNSNKYLFREDFKFHQTSIKIRV